MGQVGDDQDLVDLLSALREDSVVAEGGLYSGLPPPVSDPVQVDPSVTQHDPRDTLVAEECSSA